MLFRDFVTVQFVKVDAPNREQVIFLEVMKYKSIKVLEEALQGGNDHTRAFHVQEVMNDKTDLQMNSVVCLYILLLLFKNKCMLSFC